MCVRAVCFCRGRTQSSIYLGALRLLHAAESKRVHNRWSATLEPRYKGYKKKKILGSPRFRSNYWRALKWPPPLNPRPVLVHFISFHQHGLELENTLQEVAPSKTSSYSTFLIHYGVIIWITAIAQTAIQRLLWSREPDHNSRAATHVACNPKNRHASSPR